MYHLDKIIEPAFMLRVIKERQEEILSAQMVSHETYVVGLGFGSYRTTLF